jgi:hypothetical protein
MNYTKIVDMNAPAGFVEVLNDTMCMIPIPCDQINNYANLSQNLLIVGVMVFIIGILVGSLIAERWPIFAAVLEYLKK